MKAINLGWLVLAAWLLGTGPGSGPAAAQDVPQFRDFATAGVYDGPIAAPDFQNYPEARTFRTRLSEAAATGRVNFAGQFQIVTWGCGSGCVTGMVLDAISGAVYSIPFSICCDRSSHDGFERIVARPDSRLIVFAGLLNEEDPMGAHFFEFRDGQFIRLLTIPNDGTFQ